MPYGKKWSWKKKDLRNYVDEMQGVTIPVEVSFKGKQRVLALPKMQQLLRNARVIAIADCECREKVKGCDAPLDVCLYLNDAAEAQVKRGLARIVTIKHALETLARSNDAGLVHVAYTNRDEDEPTYICSCCACCCHSFIAMRKYGFNEAIVSSESIAVQVPNKCDDCGSCVSRCHFGARELIDGTLVFQAGKCFGCGVCQSSCPQGAISLRPRHGHPSGAQ